MANKPAEEGMTSSLSTQVKSPNHSLLWPVEASEHQEILGEIGGNSLAEADVLGAPVFVWCIYCISVHAITVTAE